MSSLSGTHFYIREDGGVIQYSTDQSSWSPITFPLTISNSNPGSERCIVEFVTGITITSGNQYIVCGSRNIQFGLPSYGEYGSRPVVTIDVDNYDGFIQNGTSSSSGYNTIYIYNLIVDGTGHSTQISAGWLCMKYFGKGATDNYIVNCSSSGDLPGGSTGSGGIIGAYAGSGSSATLFLYGCSSSGDMGQLDGGIVGSYAGLNGGSVTCEQCWSTGAIAGVGAGGIFGDYAALSGYAMALKCYTTGVIGNSAGGIFGRYAGQTGGAFAEKCYSIGNISTDAGGIFGIGAGPSSGTTTATNCYSAGNVTTSGRGIYGSGKVNGLEIHCYVANGSWSTSAAAAALQGVPIGSNKIGSSWVATIINQPYELYGMGYTPYTSLIIDTTTSHLIQSYSQTIQSGQTTLSSISPDASGNNFVILQIEDGDEDSYATITMNLQTGAISTTSNTAIGTYTIRLRSAGSYNITSFSLTIVEAISGNGTSENTCCDRPLYLKNVDYTTRNQIVSGNTLVGSTSVRRQAISYSDILQKKMAYASKRF